MSSKTTFPERLDDSMGYFRMLGKIRKEEKERKEREKKHGLCTHNSPYYYFMKNGVVMKGKITYL